MRLSSLSFLKKLADQCVAASILELVSTLLFSNFQFDTISVTTRSFLFIQNKAYSNYSDACCGLCVPSTELVSFITQCEQVFSSNFMSMLHMSKVCDRLANAILKNVEMSWFSSTGCSANIPLIVRIYIYEDAHLLCCQML